MSRRHAAVAGLSEARRTGALHVLVGFLLPVPFLLVAHQLHFWGVPPFASPRWAVNQDRSFIEVLGYVQLFVAAALLSYVGLWRRQGAVYLGWAMTLVLVMLDDALRIHEVGGGWLVRRGLVPGLLGLPEQALGELIAWAAMGVVVLLSLPFAHRVSPAGARRDSWWLVVLTAVLMFFAVGVDVVHEASEEITDNGVVDLLVTFVESGGEVAGMTGLLAWSVHVFRRPRTEARRPPDGADARAAVVTQPRAARRVRAERPGGRA